MRIVEKYNNQLTQTRKTLPKDIIKKLKTDSEFKHKTAYSLVELAYLYGYDVLNESKNARYLEFFTKFKPTDNLFTYFVDKGVNTFKITKNFAHDKESICIHRKKKNWKTGQWYDNLFDKSNLEKAILYHTFSYELCQKRVDRQFKDKDIFTKLSTEQKQNAFLINKTIGISLRPKSAIYVVDIDSDGTDIGKQKADNTLNKLVDIHPKNSIMFIERSFSGAYHVAIRFGDIDGITIDEFKKYIKHTNKTIFNSDKYAKIDTTSNGLRLLFSSTYYPIKYDYKYPYDFSEMYESVLDAIYDAKKNYSDTESMCFEYPIQIEEEKLKEEIIETPNKELQKPAKTSSIYASRLSTSFLFKERIYEGHRWEVQKKLVPRMKRLGYTKEQVWEHLLSIDDGCRAGRENPDKWQKEIYDFYDKGYAFICSNSSSYVMTDEYRPQFNHLPEDLKNLISDKSFITDIVCSCGYKTSPRNKEIFKTLLLEIYGTFVYDTKNPKQIKEKQNPNFLIGSQYSQVMCERMKDFFPILKHTDVYGLVRHILKKTLLFQEYNPFYRKGRTWIYIKDNHEDNKCKQWLLNIHNVLHYTNMNICNYILLSINNYVSCSCDISIHNTTCIQCIFPKILTRNCGCTNNCFFRRFL